MIPLLLSLVVVALVAYLTEQAMPRYAKAIRLVALLLVLLVLLRWGGLL